MKATLLARNRITYNDKAFAEVVVWQLQTPLPGSRHSLKYRLAFVIEDACVIRYDNESGKGDHRHAGKSESRYEFVSLDHLFADFERDIRRFIDEDGHP